MNRTAVLIGASALMDFTSYVYFFAVTVRARTVHGFGEADLLLVGAGFAAIYALSCFVTAGISEGRPRHRLLAIGTAGACAADLIAWNCSSLGALSLSLVALGVSNSLFWPALQARLADISEGPRSLQTRLGAFNISWGTGKTLAVVLAGWLLADRFEPAAAFALAAALRATVGAASVFGAWGPAARGATEAERGAPPPPGFLPAARLANFVCWGGSALLTWQVEKRAVELRLGTDTGGYVLGAAFGATTTTFAVLAATGGWRYRAAPLIGLQVLGAAGFALLGLATTGLALGVAAACAGVAIGAAYNASIYYSLDSRVSRSRGAGIHETILGLGAVLVPLAGAAAAWGTGWGGAPFMLVAIAVLAALPAQARWMGRNGQQDRVSRA